jgi:hypothetical protein
MTIMRECAATTAKFRRMQLKAAVACIAMLLTMLAPPVLLTWLFWSLLNARTIWGLYLASEVAFAAYYWLVIIPELNRMPEQHSPAEHEPEAVVQSFLSHLDGIDDFPHFLSSWFLDAPVESIKEDNAKELLAYALWYKTL